VIAHDTGFYRDPLAQYEVFDTRTQSGDNSGCFVAKNERCLEVKVTVSAVGEIMD
jgi:hypothetical protein